MSARKNVGGTNDWRKMYGKRFPKNDAEAAAKVRECHEKGVKLGQICLIANLSLNEVKAILGMA